MANSGEFDGISDDEVTISQIDKDIYTEVEDFAGTLDKESFTKSIFQLYSEETDQIINVRQALYEEARRIIPSVPYSSLIKRTNSGNSTAVSKLLDDIYLLFHIFEGGFPPSDIKSVLCRRDRQLVQSNFNATIEPLENSMDSPQSSINGEAVTVSDFYENTMSSISGLMSMIGGMRSEMMNKLDNIYEEHKVQFEQISSELHELKMELNNKKKIIQQLIKEKCNMCIGKGQMRKDNTNNMQNAFVSARDEHTNSDIEVINEKSIASNGQTNSFSKNESATSGMNKVNQQSKTKVPFNKAPYANVDNQRVNKETTDTTTQFNLANENGDTQGSYANAVRDAVNRSVDLNYKKVSDKNTADDNQNKDSGFKLQGGRRKQRIRWVVFFTCKSPWQH